MGIDSCSQIINASGIVAIELDALLDQIVANINFKNCPPGLKQKQIDCDTSNILHRLSYKHSKIFSEALVKDVAELLNNLASNTG